MVADIWRCPKRMGGDMRFGPDSWRPVSKSGPDSWRPGSERWSPGESEPCCTRLRKSEDDPTQGIHPDPTRQDRYVESWYTGWLESWPTPPEWCDYCGGVRPRQAIQLMQREWELEHAKPGKAYLHPPGHALAVKSFREYRDEFGEFPPEGSELWSKMKSPAPLIKVYFNHFTDRQLTAIKKLVDEQVKNQ